MSCRTSQAIDAQGEGTIEKVLQLKDKHVELFFSPVTEFEGDELDLMKKWASSHVEIRMLTAVVTAIRYFSFLGLYGDFTAESYSVLLMDKTFKIGEAVKNLSNASDPLLKNVDWLFDLHIKLLPGALFTQSLKAVDQTIAMGKAMDGNLLKDTAEAPHKAIGSIDAKDVTLSLIHI